MFYFLNYLSIKGAQIEEIWEEASNKIKRVGVGIGIINVHRSLRLADALGAERVPSIIGVINGRVAFYNEMVTVQGLKDFVLELFPRGLIEKVIFYYVLVLCRESPNSFTLPGVKGLTFTS